MNAYKVAATVAEDGTLLLQGLPLPPGKVVEVIVLESQSLASSDTSPQTSTLEQDYLTGVEAHLSEWASAEDEAAYSDL